MSEQKINHNHFPYQVISGKVYNFSSPYHQLRPQDFLIKKPLVPLLVYLTTKGVSIKESVQWCHCAAEIGDLESLQWLRARGSPWNENTCAYAAYNGHLEILQWARENEAPWDEWVCAYAAYYGHLKVLCWAYVNGFPCRKKDTKKAQESLLATKAINWSLQCKERWSKDNRELFCDMVDQIVSECYNVTYDLLPTCLSNLVITYL